MLLHGNRWKSGLVFSLGIRFGGNGVSICMSSGEPEPLVVALISSTWVVALVTPMVITIEFTYWCRSGSVDCFQNLFLVSTTCLPGVYEVMLYGPSDIMWSRHLEAVGHVRVVLDRPGRVERHGQDVQEVTGRLGSGGTRSSRSSAS